MPTFTIKNQTSPPSVIEFEAQIDDEGDFLVTANGVRLLFISHNSGHLVRFYVERQNQEKIAELRFDDNHEIAVEG